MAYIIILKMSALLFKSFESADLAYQISYRISWQYCFNHNYEIKKRLNFATNVYLTSVTPGYRSGTGVTAIVGGQNL